MVDHDFLYTVAQVGVTYAGFSTLVTVVAYRNDLSALPARIYYMLNLSIIVIAFAILPPVLHSYGLAESVIWRACSGAYALVWAVYWLNAIFQLKTRFRVWGHLTVMNKLNTTFGHPGSIALLVGGVLGFWGELTDAVYITALFIMLAMSAYLFLQIIVGLLDASTES